MRQEQAGPVGLGTLLFVLLGAGIGLMNAPVPPADAAPFRTAAAVLIFGSYLVILGLVFKGWLAGFPRWVYPYLIYTGLFALFLANVSTPGLALFGVPLWGREAWGWRAFVPLAGLMVAGLLLNRTPRGRLFRNIWDDWTLLAFGVFGFLPLLVFVSLDEVENTFAFWPQLAASLLMVLGAFLYMRWAQPGRRYLALLVCTFVAFAILAGSSGYYWNTHDVNMTTFEIYPVAKPVDWRGVVVQAVTGAGGVSLGMLLPLLVAAARRLYDRSHPAPLGSA